MTSQSAATLRSRYVEQAASDLEENRRLQQELAEKITMLKQEEALLSDIMNLAERYEGSLDPSRLPEQAQGEPALTQTRRGAAATSSSGRAASRRPASAKEATGKTAGKAAAKGKSRQPLLGDLLMDLLRTYDEPRLAKELRDELMEKHPNRTPTPQVVRNTLESLVAKGRIRRHKQQRSVMYSPVGDSQGESAEAGADES
ncbi:hypothetical protein GCM10010330_76890 [Streptomyces tendae]|uniref:BlaI/MecI/CopY family transcriptional regulator n=1 Tax=Streptomyces tendae TaxID=1932 RepID=UPI001671D231|nr:BlaI/MecI/CopY family transcriptional regulator [Streptomyces tendae]GHB11494.1 hypothetical protein GCM10010330_76890 [Streptomyces tendae]